MAPRGVHISFPRAWSAGPSGGESSPAWASLTSVRTVLLGHLPAEFEALLERRRVLGQDLFDEVWEGEYHMAPAPHPWHGIVDCSVAVALAPYAEAAGLVGSGPFNLGSSDDYRVPDGGYHRTAPNATFVATAAVVVEVVSPDDETFAKFGFYAARGVDELIVADPVARLVRCWRRTGDAYKEVDGSEMIGVTMTALQAAIRWPT